MTAMSSYFKNARNFVAKNTTFNTTYVSGTDALQFLYEHAATGAMHDSEERFPPPLCHPGTREAVIIRIKDWYGFQTRPGKPILWVHAPAGYGKTAIAGTISKMLEEMEGLGFSPLGATFFFWRTSPERNSPARFIITIAYQLAMSIPELAPHVGKAVERNPMILRKALEVQLVKLIVEPFKALGDLGEIPNRLVIVDGLDECINSEQESRVEKKYAEDQEKVQVRVLDLIHILQSHGLPLSFLILSRPEIWIKQHIESRSFTDVVEAVDLYEVGDNLKDAEKYLRAELSRIASTIEAQTGNQEWPGEDIAQCLFRRTNGHMLYASTIIRHIDDPYEDPRELLKDILDSDSYSRPDLAHSTPFSSLHELYRQIMRTCPESRRSLMLEVLEDIVVTRGFFADTVSLSTCLAILDSISGRASGAGIRAIRGLRAVLHLSASSSTRVFSIPSDPTPNFEPFIHSSFVDFLLTPAVSTEFTISIINGNQRLLWKCLECMSSINPSTLTGEPSEPVPFALLFWQSLWIWGWKEREDALLRENEYVEVVRKFLSLDLATCFTGRELLLSKNTGGNYTAIFFWHSHFPLCLESLPKKYDPLALEVLIQFLSSEAEAVRRLRRNPNWFRPRRYLERLYRSSVNANWYKSEEVVQALDRLRDDLEKMKHDEFVSAETDPLEFTSYVGPIIDYVRQE